MMRIETAGATEARWREIAAGCPEYSLLQCWSYGEAKAALGGVAVERCLILEGDGVIGIAQALVRKIPFLTAGLAWINRGPLLAAGRAGDSETIFAALQALRRHWTIERGYYLLLAPAVCEARLSPAELRRAGFCLASRSGWASARLDLTLPVETLKANLRKNWRNSLSRAQREGLTITTGSGNDLFDEFLVDYRNFQKGRGFPTTVTPELLRALQDALPKEDRMIVFVGRKGGRTLGAFLVALYGSSCEYLASHTTSEGKSLGIGQLLLWSAVCAMKERGLRSFDLGGMDSALTQPGIMQFKEGLGGTPYRLQAEIEAHNGRWLSRLVRWGVRRARG